MTIKTTYYSIPYDTKEEAQAQIDALLEISPLMFIDPEPFPEGDLVLAGTETDGWPDYNLVNIKWYFNVYDSGLDYELEGDWILTPDPNTPWRVAA